MELKIYQVDAFTNSLFSGNPAAICPLETWLADDILQKIALENNLSETAYFTGSKGSYHLRWFTPLAEVDLCGHATLAAAWVLRHELGDETSPIHFQSRSGELRVLSDGESFTLDFPLQPPVPCNPPPGLIDSLGVKPLAVYEAEDYLVHVENEQTVRSLRPDFAGLKNLPLRGVIVTAPGDSVDFVSRWFGPKVGVDEDPVTGSAHTTLAPYWTKELDRKELKAEQVSKRGGQLTCKVEGERVFISGKAVKYMEGTIYI